MFFHTAYRKVIFFRLYYFKTGFIEILYSMCKLVSKVTSFNVYIEYSFPVY